MEYRDQLTALAATYCAAKGLSEARVANLAGCDGKFFVRMREGKGCTVDTMHRVMAWFSTNWPTDKDWPDSIERPAPSKAEAA